MVARRDTGETTKTAGPRRPLERWEYPETDVRAMPGTPEHHRFMDLIFETLQAFFKTNARVYIGRDMMVYYVPNNRRHFVSPDVFIALQTVPDPTRDRYLLWEDGPIHWVLEVLSDSTRKEDLTGKRQLYAQLGVTEYFVFDPKPTPALPLQGWRLVDGAYQSIAADPRGRLAMSVLGLEIGVEDGGPSIFRRDTGERLLLPEEAQRRRAEAAEQRLQEQRTRAEAAEQRLQEQRTRAEAAEQRLEEQRAQAQAAEQRLEEQRAQAQAAEQRLEEQRAQAQAAEQRAAALAAQLEALLRRRGEADEQK